MNTLTYHNGWAIRWSGWRDMPNQVICAGFWIATKEGKAIYSTTMGLVEPYPNGGQFHPYLCLNLVAQVGWPSVREPDDRRKRDALNHLIHYLDTGKTWQEMGLPTL